MAPDERLTAAAAEAEPVRQLRAFTGWVGSGRTLTQTGRVTLADASELVGLLGTQDRLDPKIGDRVFRTKSSEELPRDHHGRDVGQGVPPGARDRWAAGPRTA